MWLRRRRTLNSMWTMNPSAARTSLSLTIMVLRATLLLASDQRYFYDDANQLARALDGTGTLLEYVYDPAGSISEIRRSAVAPGSLSILYLSPLNSGAGQTVTIYGQNFSPFPGGNVVQIGGVLATVVSATSNQLVVI